MPTVYIQRRERFSSAHQLFNPDWTTEQNDEVFGKCANENYHGHNFVLIATVKGEPNPETGFVINLVDLSRIMKEKVIDLVDHKNLNKDVPFMLGKIASTEIMIIEFWKILAPEMEPLGAQLHKLRLEETENNFVEYYGE